jgi:serine/threonine protein kinase
VGDEKYRNVDEALRAALALPDLGELKITSVPALLADDTQLTDVRFLARGGMGSVYRAHDRSLARDVAIKLVRPGRWDDELTARLRREAHTLLHLRHPNIVELLRTEERSGHLMIVLELVSGEPLRRFVRARHPLALVRQVMSACGEALCAAHAAGFAHRDFKPDNVLIRPGFVPCVLDFGLSRALSQKAPEFRTLTRPGQVMGTRTYMAPEQERGERGDAHSDQYSFALTAREAFKAAPEGAASARVLPTDLEQVLQRMLQKEPADRYPTLRQGLDELSALSLTEPDPR